MELKHYFLESVLKCESYLFENENSNIVKKKIMSIAFYFPKFI